MTCGSCYIIALVIFMENESPKRKHPRLAHYDHSAAGAYFITIYTQNRRCLLSRYVSYPHRYENRQILRSAGFFILFLP